MQQHYHVMSSPLLECLFLFLNSLVNIILICSVYFFVGVNAPMKRTINIFLSKKSFIFVSFSHSLLVSILSPKYQSQMTNPLFFSKCMHDVIQVEQKSYACCIFWYTCILLWFCQSAVRRTLEWESLTANTSVLPHSQENWVQLVFHLLMQ